MKKWDYENEQWTQLPSHLKHLPLFTRSFDFTSTILRFIWAFILKMIFKIYIPLTVKGSFKDIYEKHPKLLIISNHASHIDAVSIAAALPGPYWPNLYLAAAKDYWFRNPFLTFFSVHFLGAIPIDRKDKKAEAVKLCLTLLKKLDRIWMVLFPEGSRSKDGSLKPFKKGISIFSQETQTPILFLYIKDNHKVFPKGSFFPRSRPLTIYIGPVQAPEDIKTINENYRKWVLEINPQAYFQESEKPG